MNRRRIYLMGAKGGVGCSTMAAGLALLAARDNRHVHLETPGYAGMAEMLAVLGQPQREDPGIDLHLASTGDVDFRTCTGEVDLSVVDAGTTWSVFEELPPTGEDTVYAVLRGPDYLGLRRLVTARVRAHGLIVLLEEGRTLQPSDAEDCLGVKVVATIDESQTVARAVDAGIFTNAVHRRLRNLEALLPQS